MYEKLVNQNLNYVYTRAQSPTGMRFIRESLFEPIRDYMGYVYIS